MSEVIVGIDLGTTNSLVAVCENGKPRVLHDKDGSTLVPSIVHWGDDSDHPLVGKRAKRFRITDASHTAYSVKRFMGKGKKDIDPSALSAVDTSASTDSNVILKLGRKSFSPIELSAEILKSLKHIAEGALGVPVRKAVVTVPAYFNDSQRSATKVAGTLAGLEVVRIVNEPTAAALAYGLDRKKNDLIAVYDLGGGTFDVSVLKLHDGIFEVLATHGDTSLGGDDFDNALVGVIVSKLKTQGIDIKLDNLEVKALLIENAERLKMQLSGQIIARVSFSFGGQMATVSVTREEFNKSIEPLIQKSLSICQMALADAGLTKDQLGDIVMVGGSTRVPLVREAVRNFFGKELNTSVNPDEVVAVGAAIQADILAGHNQDMVLLDVVPLSLGIETYGGTVGKLIHRNTKIPTVAQETFTTHVDGQRNVLIHVLQGERELATDCRSLARFDLKGLPPLPAGAPKIEVTFIIDANGILTVRARELYTKTEAMIEVKPSYGLTDEQVEKMLSDSFDFAEQDIKNRQLVDTRVEADGVLRSAEKLIAQAGPLAQTDEVNAARAQMRAVEELAKGTDYVAIRDGLEKLEQVAKPLAERVMNNALQQSLSHKKVDDALKEHKH